MDLATTRLRIARPSRDLAAARRFWVDGLGLKTQWESGPDAEGGHALLMVGAPGASWHLELVEDAGALDAAPPGPEDLLVLYLGGPVEEVEPGLLPRLRGCGGTPVSSPNPYWNRWGTTLADPDGYRLVLCARSWSTD